LSVCQRFRKVSDCDASVDLSFWSLYDELGLFWLIVRAKLFRQAVKGPAFEAAPKAVIPTGAQVYSKVRHAGRAASLLVWVGWTPELSPPFFVDAKLIRFENLPGFFQDLISRLLHRQPFLLQADDVHQLCNKLNDGVQKASWLATCNDHQYDDQSFCSHGSPFLFGLQLRQFPLGCHDHASAQPGYGWFTPFPVSLQARRGPCLQKSVAMKAGGWSLDRDNRAI